MSAEPSNAAARDLLRRAGSGVLSTHSAAVSGYPFGSVVPYCLDRSGLPIVLISDLAQHTKNIAADPRVALTILGGETPDVQSSSRLTWIGDADRIDSGLDDAAERYYRYFPRSRDYHRTHAFFFFVLRPLRVRYIGGFGEIRWIDADELARPNPFSAATEAGIVEHMNRDHGDALRRYCTRISGIEPGDEAEVVMAGIDAEGIDLRVGERRCRVPFERPVATPGEARATLVAMAR